MMWKPKFSIRLIPPFRTEVLRHVIEVSGNLHWYFLVSVQRFSLGSGVKFIDRDAARQTWSLFKPIPFDTEGVLYMNSYARIYILK